MNRRRTYVPDTPLLDREVAKLRRILDSQDGARHDLILFMGKLNGRTDRINGNRLSEIIHGARLPNAEVILGIQKWMNRRTGRK